MKRVTTLAALLLSGGISYGASLAVYQDKTFYNFNPKNNFIGFTEGVKATCEGAAIPISVTPDCPSDERLCQLLASLKTSEQKLRSVQANSKVLEAISSLPRPATFDTDLLIDSAKRIGEEQATLLMQESVLEEEVRVKEDAFLKQAPTKQALEIRQPCSSELALTLPYGSVSFSTHYEANIQNTNEISVTQYLSLTNRSGIDIEAQTAMFYYRSSDQHIDPVEFRPWIVRKDEPIAKRVTAKPMADNARMDRVMMSETGVYAPAPVAIYEDARKYKINDLILPSTGVPLDVEVLKWKVPVSCDIYAYPYENAKAFHLCSFEPKYQIESHEWKVKSDHEVINENAAGEYREGQYHLYTKVEEDIQIVRKQVVDKERQTGIFGGTVRKRDGFTLTFTNKSDKEKRFTVIERIPTSATEEIQSKLLSVKSEKNVDYKLLKEGKIEMRLSLAPFENKQIEVLFEISYDKELEVNY